jgi:hypothetical protein
MDTNFSPLSHLTPDQHQALYEHARREAHALRRQALRNAAAWLANGARALWRAAHSAAISPQPLTREA